MCWVHHNNHVYSISWGTSSDRITLYQRQSGDWAIFLISSYEILDLLHYTAYWMSSTDLRVFKGGGGSCCKRKNRRL